MQAEFLNSFYQTLLQVEDYYNFLINDYINCRSYDRNQVIYQYRDRGNKYNLVWDFFISPMQAESFKLRHLSEVSFFKEWLYLKTNSDIITQLAGIREFIAVMNTRNVHKVSQHNYYECYGICMILFNIINRYYISIKKDSKPAPYNLLRLAFFYCLTFHKYHLGWDKLKSVDVLSNFARMNDYFGRETITMLFDAGIMNAIGIKFIYIWAMQKCYNILPIIPIKLHYHTNARMMHQNQTVGGVTEDAMETPFFDCFKLGEAYADQILQKYEELVESNNSLILHTELEVEVTEICKHLIIDVMKNDSINYMQFLNKTIQIEKFDGVNIVTPPYIPAPIYYTYLLKRIGLSDEKISLLKHREDSTNIPLVKYEIRVDDILGEKIKYSDDTYYTLKNRHAQTDASFRDMVLMVDENKNLHSILITGNHLYPIKKDVEWTGLFYGILCRVTLHDFRNIMYEDRLILAVFGISETYDNVLFNSEN